MVRSLLRPILFLLMLCSGVMCQPERVDPPTLTGKLVIEKPCANFVIQVLEGSIDPGKLDPLWKDSVNDSTYINVFTVANRCSFPGNFAEGDTLTFQLGDDGAPRPLCDLCYVFYPTPPVSNSVRNVQKLK
jgi:hypothetical protein